MEKHEIKLIDLTKVFSLGLLGKKKIVAVDRVNMSIRSGEILGILGESGSGKSTLARMILRLLKPTKGKVLFDDIDIWKLRKWKDIKEYYRKVQGVFQDPYASFNPRRKVLDSLLDAFTYLPQFKSRDEKIEYLSKILSTIGLDIRDIEEKYPHQFSGGQLQRLSIVRALIPGPIFIIADEPVSMVDASTRIDILNIFADLKERFNVSSVIIGHDYSLAYYISDRIIVLYKGQIVEEGPPEVLEDPYHPYTRLLKESVPLIDRKWEKKIEYGIGNITSTTTRRKGCIFADRCPFKKPICEEKEPPIVFLGNARVKCWLYTEK